MPDRTAWVVLFRGVGGATQLPVRRLREVLEGAGFGNVATYINSGNAVLTSPLAREEVQGRVAEACAREMGFAKDVHAVPRADWAEVVAQNPFPEAADAPTTLHVAVLAREPDKARVEALRALTEGGDAIAVLGRVAYLRTPGGLSRSKLGERFDKGIGVPNTARNWTTVTRLLLMARAAEGAA